MPLIVLAMLIVACKSNKQVVKNMEVVNNTSKSTVNKPTVVYKTTKNFSDFVPVIMNAERTKIVSYPAPTDLSIDSKPTKLKNDYLLDNRGITENVVFLNYTYKAYAVMKEAPAMDEMLKNIKEKYPLKELILCGSRYEFKGEVKELNALIDAGFPGCKKINIIPMGVTLDM
jgi:hypothetical protein